MKNLWTYLPNTWGPNITFYQKEYHDPLSPDYRPSHTWYFNEESIMFGLVDRYFERTNV